MQKLLCTRVVDSTVYPDGVLHDFLCIDVDGFAIGGVCEENPTAARRAFDAECTRRGDPLVDYTLWEITIVNDESEP